MTDIQQGATATAVSDEEVVVGSGGWGARARPASPDADGRARLVLRPDDGGPALTVPTDLFVRRGDGVLFLNLPRAAVAAHSAEASSPGTAAGAQGAVTAAAAFGSERVVVPVIEEELEVRKELVDTGGGVRVRKTVTEREEAVDVPLAREEVTSVERVAVNRPVDAAFGPREEGDTLIVPLFEEILVVEKRLVLKEELRITRRRVEDRRERRTVTLRREEAVVEPRLREPETGIGRPE